jgi:hypothetical protein
MLIRMSSRLRWVLVSRAGVVFLGALVFTILSSACSDDEEAEPDAPRAGNAGAGASAGGRAGSGGGGRSAGAGTSGAPDAGDGPGVGGSTIGGGGRGAGAGGSESRGGSSSGGRSGSNAGKAGSDPDLTAGAAGASAPGPGPDGKSPYLTECHGDSLDCADPELRCLGLRDGSQVFGYACSNQCGGPEDCSDADSGAEATVDCVDFVSSKHCLFVCKDERSGDRACPTGMSCYVYPGALIGYCLWR